MKLSLHAIRYTRIFLLSTLSPLYICREPSTNHPFLCKTNPILSAAGGLQMNLNSCATMAYENKRDWTLGQNKPNSNPIKPNFRTGKIDAKSVFTKDYRKKDDFVVRINKPNFRKGQNERKLNYNKVLQKKTLFSSPKNKPNSNPIAEGVKIDTKCVFTKDYEENADKGYEKTNPNKPNFPK